MDIVERFKKYISFETMSSETSGTHPSSYQEILFGNLLVEDLKELGLEKVQHDEHGYVYAFVNNNKEKTIGLIAHMDTAPTIEGGIKNPQIIKNYDGGAIELNEDYIMTPIDFPVLESVVGEDLMVTDGEHLLGGDDKAGISIIFSFLEYYLEHKNELNYNLSICFTPDEEIGEGPLFFDTKKMKADIAFTIDGESIYEANYENFNASSALVKIFGLGVHPGSAKGLMINAGLLGIEFNNNLPQKMIPSETEGYEGFIHLCGIKGDVEECTLEYILRDHDQKLLNKQKELLEQSKKDLLKKYPKAKIELSFKDQYRNMNEYFIEDPRAIKMINNAYLALKMPLKYQAIRGGTDGASITYMGLPCPNLGDGDYNPHGRFEFVSLTQMKKMKEIIISIFKGEVL